MAEAEVLSPDDRELQNSLNSLVAGICAGGNQLSQTDTLFINNRWYMLSNNRQLLSELYVEHGIIQTLVDQPVDDAFRSGFEIKSKHLDADDMEKLMVYLERHRIIHTIMQALKWTRLFGGGGVFILTDQDPKTPLKLDSITPDTVLEFKAVDMWELNQSMINLNNNVSLEGEKIDPQGDFYDYYGFQIHKSRVLRLEGKQPPSFVRPRLRGWGMSELEKIVRSLNQYMKNQDVAFDLLDEAKVDIYKFKGFNTALAQAEGTNKIHQRAQLTNMMKNYQHAINMDMEDEYEQKQVSFTGLSEVLVQIRQGLAADLKMPMTKLFGISAAGFNSGEDDIENYNSMIDGEIRSKVKFVVVDVIAIACRHLFGFAPDDLMIRFNSLRMLNASEEEDVKDKQFARTVTAYDKGLMSDKAAKEAFNKGSLLPIEVDENQKALPQPGMNPLDDPKAKKTAKPPTKKDAKK